MPEKASDRSTWLAAGPATSALVPSTVPAAARTSSTTSASPSPRSGSTCTTACRALPSSEGKAGEGSPTMPGLPASPATARVAAVVWAPVIRSPSVVHTTIAGSVASWSNAFRWSRTCVDSALWGRKEAWSLVATSPSFPAYGPSIPPTPSQTINRASGTSQRARRGADVMWVPMARSSYVNGRLCQSSSDLILAA